MKLVELLAAKLPKWADTTTCYVQDRDGSAWPCKITPKFDGGVWGADNFIDQREQAEMIVGELSPDYATAIVTKDKWQAERDRQKGGEWNRHRGNKMPIEGGLYIEARLRCGDIQRGYAQDFIWPHAACEVEVNLMKYRVISQPQAEEVECRGPFPCAQIGEPENAIEFDIEFPSGVCKLEAQVDQIDGPIKWRDTANELDAYIEEYTRERDGLISRLALEGFALIPAMTAVMGVADIDMSDWRNWKVGDKIRMTARDWCDLTKGAIYEIVDTGDDFITIIDDVDYRRSLEVDDETMFEHGKLMDFEFVSSP
jgi:hypothetical protein